ncbi:MAG: hypothetical protein A4E74_01253 [Syntrophus sp. PtaB.Bin075]|nr:MAG: hypothetical protein A4E74_01253 [Syntrophus sp. PtaB.Bin075]
MTKRNVADKILKAGKINVIFSHLGSASGILLR